MPRHLTIFAIAFILAGAVTLVVRAGLHRPAPAAPVPSPAAGASAIPMNTVCAMCGMDVDPSLPTAIYQGKTIGFGCAGCPLRFANDPERYGPHFLAGTRAP
jgi:hypothetical protein